MAAEPRHPQLWLLAQDYLSLLSAWWHRLLHAPRWLSPTGLLLELLTTPETTHNPDRYCPQQPTRLDNKFLTKRAVTNTMPTDLNLRELTQDQDRLAVTNQFHAMGERNLITGHTK